MPKQDALVTREYLDERLEKFKEEIKVEIREEFKEENSKLLTAIKEDNAQLKNDILGRLVKKANFSPQNRFSL